ncbi:hypothetical protein H0H92_015617 [Tricholoma furcatifolium]|nr:hypothetical protein H0H92_015617 [Tricholoma furcatifolium]
MGVLPDLKGIASWIPMDVAAAAIVDAALAVNPSPPSLNLVHPQPIAWKELMIFFQASISEALGRNLEIVPLAEWMALVERKAKAATKKARD